MRQRDDRDILEISSKCSRTAAELLAELKTVQLDSRGGRLQALSKGLRAIRRKHFVEGTQKKLERYQQILDTRILVRLDTRSLQQAEDFQRCDQNVRDLVTALNHCHKTVAQLLAYQGQTLRDRIDQ